MFVLPVNLFLQLHSQEGINKKQLLLVKLIVILISLSSASTRGLDVGAIEYIHKRLIEERDNGKAVLVVSFELDEILNVSDRIAVIHDGKIQGIVSPETTNKTRTWCLDGWWKLGKGEE